MDIYTLEGYDEALITKAAVSITRYVDAMEHSTKLNQILKESYSGIPFPQKSGDIEFYRTRSRK
jgi:hypothetical protein